MTDTATLAAPDRGRAVVALGGLLAVGVTSGPVKFFHDTHVGCIKWKASRCHGWPPPQSRSCSRLPS